jgi:predicted nuclease of predicted toxin-antitoxin system
MKFLVDAQLPLDLKKIVEEFGCDCIHVKSLPNKDRSSDVEIREIADAEDRIVITKDFDFYYSHAGINSPKKLLIVTTGNIRNKILLDLFQKNFGSIRIAFKSCSLVEISNTEVIGIE